MQLPGNPGTAKIIFPVTCGKMKKTKERKVFEYRINIFP
jgi:hypothetical protein